jgi:hypothetical protein
LAIGRIQIRTEPAQLAYEIKLGQYDIKQPKAHYELRQPRAEQHIEQPLGELHVDSSRAWDALGVGSNLEMMNRIYSNARNIALQGIAKIVENGNRMADIVNKNDAIAELAADWRVSFSEFDTTGLASPMNVDVRYEPGNLVIEATPRPVELETWVSPPEVQYIKGKHNMYMQSYGKVEIIPPQIDIAIK